MIVSALTAILTTIKTIVPYLLDILKVVIILGLAIGLFKVILDLFYLPSIYGLAVPSVLSGLFTVFFGISVLRFIVNR